MSINLENYIYIHSLSQNPFVNLAYESYLLENIKEKAYLFTYINNPSLVIGNFQNPWIECNLLAAKNDGVHLVRRFSGGGAVYHDPGNLNLSFIVPKHDYNKNENALFMKNFLEVLGLPVFINERIDLRIKDHSPLGKKISGSAFKQKKNSSYHHMTLLCSSNLDLLNFYLFSSFDKIASKGTTSVRSHVANLNEFKKEITPVYISSLLEKKFLLSENIAEEEMLSFPFVKELAQEMNSFSHFFGKTPRMEFLYQDEKEEYRFVVHKSKIDFEILSSSFHPSFQNDLKEEIMRASFDLSLLTLLKSKFMELYPKEMAHLISFLQKNFYLG